ncbi:MAG: aminopeptidase P family protein [Desulfobacteraceae bacterium]|nr:aminopeptidase P family protein [Desulfobacteraceae bacterium]
MKDALMLDFPVEEYEQRKTRLVREMEKQNMDAVVFTSRDNLRYFSGFQTIIWMSNIATPGILIITRDGDMAMVGSKLRLDTIAVSVCVEDLRGYDNFTPGGIGYVEMVYEVLKEKKVHTGTIGLEIGKESRMHLSYENQRKLIGLIGDRNIVSTDTVVWPVRKIKSRLEIELLRKISNINNEAFDIALSAITPGMSEVDLYRRFCIDMFTLGADEVMPLGIRAGAERYAQGNSSPSTRPIGKGEMILVDGGGLYKGYSTDIIRQAIIGKPTDRQRALYDFSVETCMEGLNAVKAGATAESVTRRIDAYARKSRFADCYRTPGWSGHGLGQHIHEPPIIGLGSTEVLEPGMFLAIEPDFYEENVGVFGIEQNILVTDTGYELLSTVSHELRVL